MKLLLYITGILMSDVIESTLIFEESTIKQTGDVRKERNFNFVRPKVDYRFDITPSLQFRATVEKDVAQLSFNDFTANINDSDDDQDAIAGNPDIRQGTILAL
ncbi:MAG: hypothetical protein CM1200mP40_33650 [Gammaproteobacteria bacterium]|nr:MAG: hypothetical protein CM1200mP40_33650 [Gammaproteobacteria bacterium]